ncbi:MAG: amino acid permease [Saprospiraceae bacterium]|nr:amino acid permease [Saprospiraceae bacterium]
MKNSRSGKLGSAPVFFTAISTILGAILFLRFGFAVGQLGFISTLLIVIIGHAVTIPTAMAIAEIATNQKVEGGGEYFIISRSFGLVIGSTIGLALYLSQAISVAFYVMAFAEAFTSLIDWLTAEFRLSETVVTILKTKQTISIPALLILTYVMLTKGANLGVKMLYVVVGILAFSLVAFFCGETEYAQTMDFDPVRSLENTTGIPSLSFFTVFAIIFPAFTGMTAGVGLSGDLKNPGKSIPFGTMTATIAGMLIYGLIAFKFALSASPAELSDTTRIVMEDIAWQGWLLVPLGLAAATISSALGSIMVAPRTLQAIAKDQIFPSISINHWLSRGRGENQEPFNASVATIAIAAIFIIMGAIDSVAKIISMFFMVTYGSLCLISFLNHFAADPSYRPRFKSRWYFSLFGAVACLGLMFFMSPTYAFVAITAITAFYLFNSYYNRDKQSLAVIFQGAIFQFSRSLQVFLQKAKKETISTWRPSAVAISEHSFQRLSAFDLLAWISHKYGFGTYIHVLKGYLSKETNALAHQYKERLIQMAEDKGSNIFIDTLVSPSYTSTIAQVVQLPGIAGTKNNLFIFEFSADDGKNLHDIVDNLKLIKSVDFDVIILRTSIRGFGLFKHIHVWISTQDYDNANLMILLAYILIGHRDWRNAEIEIYTIIPEDKMQEERERLSKLVEAGQLPISSKNITVIPQQLDVMIETIIQEKSKDADLCIIGFREETVKHDGTELFQRINDIGNIMYVNAAAQKVIIKNKLNT